MLDMLEFLRDEGVSADITAEIEKFRDAYPEEDETLRRRVPDPRYLYYGKDIWEEAITAILCGENLLLVGPKATGKNVLAENLATVFGRPSWNVSFYINTDAATLLGTDTFENGAVQLRKGPIYQCAETGGFGVLDEINMAKNESLAVLHATLDFRRVIDVPGYDRIPLSLADGIPLVCKGDDYGTVGAEPLVSTAEGRAYGAELTARWQIPGKINLVGSATLFRSEYRNGQGRYVPSAWDNRYVVNLSGTYDLPRSWSVGARLSWIGGAPYTPYDEAKSSLVSAWDAQGRPYYDYARYNTERLAAFGQLDLRIDKTFYFRRCMLGLYVDLQNVTASRL